MSLLAKPERPILCYVTDRRSLSLSTSADAHKLLFDSVERAAAAGADWIQLREKDYSGKEWEELVGESLQRISRVGATTRLFVNDRMDVAFMRADLDESRNLLISRLFAEPMVAALPSDH